MQYKNCVTTILTYHQQIAKYASSPGRYCFDQSLNAIEKSVLKSRKRTAAPDNKIIDLLVKKIDELRNSGGVETIPQKQWEEIRHHITAFANSSSDIKVKSSTELLFKELEEVFSLLTRRQVSSFSGSTTKKMIEEDALSLRRIATYMASTKLTVQQVFFIHAAELLKNVLLQEFEKIGGRLKVDAQYSERSVIDWRAVQELTPEEMAISMKIVEKVGRKSTLQDYQGVLCEVLANRSTFPRSLDRIVKVWLLYFTTCHADVLVRCYEKYGKLQKTIDALSKAKTLFNEHSTVLMKILDTAPINERKYVILQDSSSELIKFLTKKYTDIFNASSEYFSKSNEISNQYRKIYIEYHEKYQKSPFSSIKELENRYKDLPTPELFANNLHAFPEAQEFVNRFVKDIYSLPDKVLEGNKLTLNTYLTDIFYGAAKKGDIYFPELELISGIYQIQKGLKALMEEKIKELKAIQEKKRELEAIQKRSEIFLRNSRNQEIDEQERRIAHVAYEESLDEDEEELSSQLKEMQFSDATNKEELSLQFEEIKLPSVENWDNNEDGENWITVHHKKNKKKLPLTANEFFTKAHLAIRVKDWFLHTPKAFSQEPYKTMLASSLARAHLFHSYPGIITFYAIRHGLARKWHSKTTNQDNLHFTIIGEIEEYGQLEKRRYRGLFNDCIDVKEGAFEVYHHCFTERSFDEIMDEYAQQGFILLDTFQEQENGIEYDSNDINPLQFHDEHKERFVIDQKEHVVVIDDTTKKVKYTLSLPN